MTLCVTGMGWRSRRRHLLKSARLSGDRAHRFRPAFVMGLAGLTLLLSLSLAAMPTSLAQESSPPATQENLSQPPDGSDSDELSSDSDESPLDSPSTEAPAIEAVEGVPVELLTGIPLLEMSSSAELTALERANIVERRLQQFVDADGAGGVAPKIEIDQRNGSPTLLLNGSQLLTVTDGDAALEKLTPEALAEQWAQDLREQLPLAIDEKRPDFWREQTVTALGILVLTGVFHLGIVLVMRGFRQWLSQKLASYDLEAEPPRLLNVAFRVTIALMLLALWLSSLSYLAGLFPLTRRISYGLQEKVLGTLTTPMIPIGEGYSVVELGLLVALMVGLVIAAGALTELLKSRFLDVLGLSRGVQEAIATLFKYSFILISGGVLLQLWGLDLSSLAILASALSVGIGFGLQDIAKNFGSGLVLVFERPIQVGDFVEVGGYSGTIEKVGARSTTLRTLDNLDVFVPNSRFLQEEVTNWSHNRSSTRIKVPVGVAYGSDLKAVEEALLEAATSSKNILKMPEPTVFFTGFGDSSLDFVLLVWIARPQQHVRIKSELNFKVDAAFRRRGIEIPFPQRDLHVRSGQLPITMLGESKEPMDSEEIAEE